LSPIKALSAILVRLRLEDAFCENGPLEEIEMMWGEQDGMGWWMVFGGIAWLLLIGLIAYVALVVASRFAVAGDRRESRQRSAARELPIEIARRRYAAGEISREEYQRIRDDLGPTAPG
jgi:putative membrane protein